MATAKKTETVPAQAVDTMNIYQKLQAVRNEFYDAGAKKTGKNLHAEFMYFELEDIVPIAQKLFTKYHLFLHTSFTEGMAMADVINIDRSEERLRFGMPMLLLSEPAKFRMNEIQGMGSAVTYYRRYLYFIILDLVEKDEIDVQDGKKNLLPDPTPEATAEKQTKPATKEERSVIKNNIIEKANATEKEITELKGLLKNLLNIDPEQEDFVHEIAVKTDGFRKLTHDQCESLIFSICQMIEAYGKVN